MAKNDNLGDFLTDIANAIREKKGTVGSINAQNFASEIASIETGGGEGGDTPTSGMPVIGDGRSRLYIELCTNIDLPVTITIKQTKANSVQIDWGDGSVKETISATGSQKFTHTYANIGEYVITLTTLISGGWSSYASTTFSIFGNQAKSQILKGAEVGGSEMLSEYAFNMCSNLEEIELSDKITSIPKYAFKDTAISKIVLKNTITSVANYAFQYCYSLRNVQFNNASTSLGENAFYYCKRLSKIVLPANITSIATNSFYECDNLRFIEMPDNITTIGKNAFYQCASLRKVVFPSKLTTIGQGVFSGNNGAELYDFSKCTSVPTLENTSAFNSIPSKCYIVVPDTLYDSWIVATNWSSRASNIIKSSEYNTLMS